MAPPTPSPSSPARSLATPARILASRTHSPKPSPVFTPSTRDGRSSSTTTTSPRSHARTRASPRCLATRRCAGTCGSRGSCARRKKRVREGDEAFTPRETRSYEVAHVHGLWHLDFHQGSRAVLTTAGEWKKPQLLGILDDCSRLCCHLQWYTDETAESLVHGLSQAFHKRGLPRALLTDNGAAMLAAETTEGLERLGIVHHTTLPYSPEQNGKQESFWGQIEGRLLPMLEGEPELTLELLNIATQAWVEEEYHRKEHSEIKETPLERYLRGPTVGRESPNSDALRRAFRTELSRIQRRSDGTVTVDGIRFEVPSAYRTLLLLRVRVARWDLSIG